jgi:hypothetical protein
VAVVRAYGWSVVVHGVEHPDGVGGLHSRPDLSGIQPGDFVGFGGRQGCSAGGEAPEDEGDDAATHVFIDAGEALGLDRDAGLLVNLSDEAGFYGLVQL